MTRSKDTTGVDLQLWHGDTSIRLPFLSDHIEEIQKLVREHGREVTGLGLEKPGGYGDGWPRDRHGDVLGAIQLKHIRALPLAKSARFPMAVHFGSVPDDAYIILEWR